MKLRKKLVAVKYVVRGILPKARELIKNESILEYLTLNQSQH
jgi:hypothetical protein